MSAFQCSLKSCQEFRKLAVPVPGPVAVEETSVNVVKHTGADTCSSTENGTDEAALQGRVEVRATFPKSASVKRKNKVKEGENSFKVVWSRNGDAVFHSACWDHVLKLAQKRGSGNSRNDDVVMATSERTMVKEAAETAEYHDPVEKVEKEALRIAEMIRQTKHCVVFTGAGISTSAGIGDYRGKTGKWTEQDREKNSLNKEDCSAPSAKKSKKDEETESTGDSDNEEGVPYEDLRPTYTHEAIVKLMELGYIQYVISQNGDGLHLLSGVPQEKISELHGNVFLEKCEVCGKRYERPHYVMDDLSSQYFEDLEDVGKTDVKKPKHAKKCDLCGLNHRTGRKCDKKNCRGHLIDTIINFRDNLEEDILDRATEQAKSCDLMICLGSTLMVTPASRLVKKGKKPLRVIICNRQETDMDEICLKRKSRDDETPLGSRVFGDCDLLLQAVMKNLLSADELTQWEDGREDRLRNCDRKRK